MFIAYGLHEVSHLWCSEVSFVLVHGVRESAPHALTQKNSAAAQRTRVWGRSCASTVTGVRPIR
ncbi:hypothetical protein KDH_62680 [Dictyobacter sp. S3.2.2.5]|uniref:Uncharacterized protein n=1 Tax=Dictyobacter halimunensis TaxID=3026934 RepID=A0ABQ6FYS7_9CHLR|nr:hypothetical protein KDH_62680 [Dictyobacter sp. S3.2.2.5]